MKRTAIAGVLAAALGLGMGLGGCSRGASEAELTASAKALLEKKDLKGAVIQLKAALQQSPASAELRLLLGQTLLAGGDPVAALVELRKAQELQAADEKVIPELARAMLLVGEEAKLITQYGDTRLKDRAAAAELKTALAAAYAVQNDSGKAMASADEALALKPGHAAALIVKARLLAVSGDLDGALGLLDEVLRADAGHERAGLLKAELLLQGKRNVEGAMQAYRQVLTTTPGSVAARAALANMLFQQKKTDEAKVEFAELKKVAPNHPETLFFAAQLAFADKDFKQTREISEQALKMLPDNVRLLELAGAAEYRLKNYLQAEALLGKALKLAPKQTLTRLMLAQTFLRSGQPNKVVELLKPVIEAGQAEGATLSLLGEAYLQMGDAARSEAAFKSALKASPDNKQVRTTAALAQLSRGESGAAVTELEALARGDDNPRADLALVSARLRQNDLAGALKAIDGLEKKMPDQALPLQLRGRVLTMKKDLPGATKAFEAALAKDPSYFPAVASLAAIDLNAGKPELVRQRFDAYAKAQPRSWEVRVAIAELAARTNESPARVTELLREAVKINPSEPRPHLVLVRNLMSLGDSKAALLAAQEATAALPNNLEIMGALGGAEMAAGDQQRAISTFKKLAGLQPSNPQHQLRLADAYMKAEDRSGATAALRRAAELQPDLLAAQRGLIGLALQDKRPQDALAVAREVQKRSPKDAVGFALEGDIEMQGKNWDQAAVAYRTALQRTPAPDTAAKLHAALTGAGKAADAERVVVDWQRERPKDPSFFYFLGDMALGRSDFAGAEARYRKVLDIQPENALALNNLAWLMVKQGKPGALAVAEKANKLLPDRAPLLDTLSIALEAENQLPQAIDAQKRAIAQAPTDGNLTLRLAKLYIKTGDKAGARTELDKLGKLGEKFGAHAEVATLLKTL